MDAHKCDPLHKIPWEILDQMKELAWYASWHAANHFAGNKDDAKRDMETSDHHYKLFLEFGLPKEECAFLFKQMAWAAAWSTANERMGSSEDAASNKAKVLEYQKAMVATGEITEGLANDLAEFCWAAAWHTANSRKFKSGLFHKDDAAKDKERFEKYYKLIGGDCRLACIDFIQDRAVLINPKKPKFFAEQKLENKSDSEQEMSVTFSHWNTQTKSWSKTVSWKFTVAGAIGGCYFVAGGLAASVSYTHSKTEGGSITDGEKKEYKFPVKVGPRSAVIAKGIVQECTCEVPYFMVFDIEGKRYCRDGVWSGIVAGNVEYEIGETIHLD